jgi:hypothetical protein
MPCASAHTGQNHTSSLLSRTYIRQPTRAPTPADNNSAIGRPVRSTSTPASGAQFQARDPVLRRPVPRTQTVPPVPKPHRQSLRAPSGKWAHRIREKLSRSWKVATSPHVPGAFRGELDGVGGGGHKCAGRRVAQEHSGRRPLSAAPGGRTNGLALPAEKRPGPRPANRRIRPASRLRSGRRSRPACK